MLHQFKCSRSQFDFIVSLLLFTGCATSVSMFKIIVLFYNMCVTVYRVCYISLNVQDHCLMIDVCISKGVRVIKDQL